jgi:predicted  nucleic acid-binding Zn-ribbon protein
MHIQRLNVSKLEQRIDDLESENRRLRSQISDLLPFHDAVGFYADNMDIALQRAERAEAEAELLRDELASMTAQHDELHDLWLDAEQGKTDAEAEAAKWRWAATHEWVCPLDEMNPGEPGSYIVERNVHPALLARAEEWSKQ